MSSMFCFNTKNPLTSDAVNKLSFMSVLSEKVKLNSTSDLKFEKSECSDLLWVVRDYSLKSTLTPVERLEKFLEEEKSNNIKEPKTVNNINERNEIHNRLKSAFRTMDCQYLPCPVTDGTNGMMVGDALQNMDKIEWSKLREPFRVAINNICESIKNKIQPKKINKLTAVNGRVFAAYIKEIVNHLNLNETIYLTDTFTASIKIVAFETLEMVNLKYTDEMNKLVYPFDWKRFNVFEANLNEKCVKHLKLNIIGNNETLNETLINFSDFKQNFLESFKEENEKAIFHEAYNSAKTI